MPVEDARSQRELARTFDSIMDDTRWSWALRADGSWERIRGKKGSTRQSLHTALMRRARARARRAGTSHARADSPADALGTMEAVRVANRRRGREHASPARCRPGRTAGAARAPGEGTARPRRGGRALRLHQRRQVRRGRRGRARPDAQGPAARLRADRDPRHLARPTERQQRRVRRRARPRHGRSRADPELGGGGDAGVGRSGLGARGSTGERSRLRYRRRLGAAGRRHARGRPGLGALGRPRLAAAHDPAAHRLRPALGRGGRGCASGGCGRVRGGRPAGGADRAGGRRHRASAAARGRHARHGRPGPRRSRSSRSSSGRRSPSATASRHSARPPCSGARSSSPRRSGGSASRSSSPAVACAKARRSRSSAPAPRRTPS